MDTAELPRRWIVFAGRRWWVKRASPPAGPGPNLFDDAPGSVDVDRDGRLVLRVRRTGGPWVCAEVVGEESTGYGTYEWTIGSDVSALDRNVVLGMFTWSDEPAPFNRELDIEVSAWSRDRAPIGKFVVQPYSRPGHVQEFAVPRAASWWCSLDWSPGTVTFRADDAPCWTFATPAVPSPGGVHPRINLWLFGGADPHRDAPVTVTIGYFAFTPHDA